MSEIWAEWRKALREVSTKLNEIKKAREKGIDYNEGYFDNGFVRGLDQAITIIEQKICEERNEPSIMIPEHIILDDLVSDEFKVVRIADVPEPKIENRWIPVGERLPEENGMYLVTRKANYPQKCRGKMYQTVTYAYYNTLFKTWNTNGYPNVVAWMPLPEPWKGDEE